MHFVQLFLVSTVTGGGLGLLLLLNNVNSMEDYMLTCSRPVKKSRSFFSKEPCDFAKGESWCNLPGEAYPWHAVRRFVFENQGLMRRMYGEVRQLSLLRMEFSEDFDNTIEHEGRSNENMSETVTVNVTSEINGTGDSKTSSKEENTTNEPEQTQTTMMDLETTTTTALTQEASVEFSDELRLDDGHVLFQDIEKKNNLVAKNKMSANGGGATLKAVNACPVKEEVVAPYWANNTRGEVLALLNLYPFEQYVHWEKCTFENKQMRCRDGCRCEQQYRLHRLLAFDPTNECRGIFSDWFRFPSCCVCRCYLTSAEEFQERVKFNRSPRKLQIIDGPDVNGVDDSHFFYRSLNLQPR